MENIVVEHVLDENIEQTVFMFNLFWTEIDTLLYCWIWLTMLANDLANDRLQA